MKIRISLRAVIILVLAFGPGGWHRACALGAALDVNEYAHTAWTVRDGFSLGNIYAIAQTPDGYLWLGSEFGLFRFDGVHSVPWEPPSGQHLPAAGINDLMVARDGTLWIGTFSGLLTWNGRRLVQLHQFDGQLVTALYQDREGTVWVGTLGTAGQLYALRGGRTSWRGTKLDFGKAVWTVHEDGSGTIWAGADSGLWRIKPGPPRRFATSTTAGLPYSGPIGLADSGEGGLLVAIHNAGMMQLVGDELTPYPIRIDDSNKLLRDRDGELWIGTVERGLIHVHQGKADTYTQLDGLSGDIVLSLFEDREGSIWVSTTDGLDRFRELPVSTLSARQGLSSDATQSVLAAADGSLWIGSHDGLNRWENGKMTVYRRANGLPDDSVQSLYQDHLGRIWAFTDRGLAYLKDGRFVAVQGVPGGEVNSMAGDEAGDLWLSRPDALWHLHEGRLVGRIPWTAFGRHHNASVLLADPRRGGLWVGFWRGGGVFYFKGGQVRAAYMPSNGLRGGAVTDLRLDSSGALWVSTLDGVSRLDDGRITSLGSNNGLPCDTTMWTLQDDRRSLWMYTACGLVHLTWPELSAWIANPNARIEATVLGPQDGVRRRNTAASAYGPHAAIAADGRIWFLSGGGVQVLDPDHLVSNRLAPPVHVVQVIADGRIYWQNLRASAPRELRLPPRTRDLEIDYAALSLVEPEENQFRYRLDGRDRSWYDAGNRRLALYTDLPPGQYRFHVIASNNSGVWNEQGASIEFSIAPEFWQTFWFRGACGAAFLAMLALLYWLRARQLAMQFHRTLHARVQERTRIARDLHDTLLQSFQGVLLQFGAGLRLLAREPQKAREVLEEAVEQAAHAIKEGREAVQGLREESSSDLAAPIARLARELAGERQGTEAPTVRLEVQGTVRPLHPMERDEVFRIAAEALRNAVNHSRGTQVEVELRYDASEFRLRVRDNGRGIDPKLLATAEQPGHFGLRGMRERAALAGGKLALWSAPNAGLEVELVIPASRAYPTARRRLSPRSR
ncbi:MAG TPA: two-component regulator propeller domain-containing protein [Steroidobacteraceae bacterium]